MINILGISAFYHDSAATLIQDGNIIAAAQEERFSRKKHDDKFPKNAINYVLEEGKVKLGEIDYVVFFEKPFLKFERLLETYLAFAPKGYKSFSLAMPIWLREKLFQKKYLFDLLQELDEDFKDIKKIKFSEHHYSHAASAFYPSPFKEAIILTLDVCEDFEKVIKYHLNNKPILKRGFIGIKTKYWDLKGGLQTDYDREKRLQLQNYCAEELLDRYSNLLFLRKRKSGLLDVRFRYKKTN